MYLCTHAYARGFWGDAPPGKFCIRCSEIASEVAAVVSICEYMISGLAVSLS